MAAIQLRVAIGLLGIANALLVASCVREPVDAVCPDLATGDLVITEVRGEQDGTDTLGQWVEVFNASGGATDLQGLKLRLRKLDGTNDVRIPIRRSVPVAAGDYVVLGVTTDVEGQRPAYVDYGFLQDFDADWYPAGAVSIEGCAVDDPAIDVMTYNALPDNGTYALGLAAPTAAGNDTASNWCTDSSNSNAGSPGEANPQCSN